MRHNDTKETAQEDISCEMWMKKILNLRTYKLMKNVRRTAHISCTVPLPNIMNKYISEAGCSWYGERQMPDSSKAHTGRIVTQTCHKAGF
ncbi:hypothetical protein BaRGS_00036042 [Batillaria attramentaria]|uniref:Uncharacterized protein n=1 Tax=Batillaria attramentaria TaxID=370345 RepID=A0ABD0JD25_9CAEN